MNRSKNLFESRLFDGNDKDYIEIGLRAKIVGNELKFEVIVYIRFHKFSNKAIRIHGEDIIHLFNAFRELPGSTLNLYCVDRINPDGLATLVYDRNGRLKRMVTNNNAIDSWIFQKPMMERLCRFLNNKKVEMEIQSKLLKKYLNQNALSLFGLLHSPNDLYNHYNHDVITGDISIYAYEIFEEYVGIIESESEAES